MSKTFIVIGCGSMGRRRMRHALELAGAQVFVYDLRPDRMAEVKAMFPAVTCLDGVEAVRSQPADGMFISVPPSEHEFYMFLALDRRLPFMVEQPISHETERLGDILRMARERAVAVHVSCNQRFNPRVETLKQVLESGKVGRPLTAIFELGEWLPDWHPYEPYTDYYPSWRRMGGGLDAVCDLDWLRYLWGEPREAKSMCSRKSDLTIDTYDVAQFLFDFADGPQVMLHTDMLQRPFSRESRVVCSNGVAIHSHPDTFWKVYYADEKRWEEIPYSIDFSRFPTMQGKSNFAFAEPQYQADSASFLALVEAGGGSTASLESGIRNVEIVKGLVFP